MGSGARLVSAGVLGLALSAIWYVLFALQVGVGRFEPICFFLPVAECDGAYFVADRRGFLAYQPIAFWTSFVLMLVGAIIIFRQSKKRPKEGPPGQQK